MVGELPPPPGFVSKHISALFIMKMLRQKAAKGFSLVELLFVVVILGIVTTFALIGISQARTAYHLSNNGDILQAYLQRIFADARRRHALGASRAVVEVLNQSQYKVIADLDGDGNPEERIVSLTDNVRFNYDPANPPRATVDWRGTVAEGTVAFNLRSPRNEALALTLSSAGDSNIDGATPAIPVINITTSSADVKTSTVVNGNTAPNPNISPTPALTPLPVCSTSQLPETHNCRCNPGKVVKSDGKCS